MGRRQYMKRIAIFLAAAALVAVVVAARSQTSARTDGKTVQSAKEIIGATPLIELKNEPAPKLIVDPPLPDRMAIGVVLIQWRAENVHIVPVFGTGALSVSPRVGHLHVHVDDAPWLFADWSENTIDLGGMPPGPHKVLIELVNAVHQVFPGQAKTVTFTIPEAAAHPH
jgi:hypothetical protein